MLLPLDKITSLVIEVVKETAFFIKKQHITSADIEVKARNSLVTYVDKTSEKMLVEKLGKILPGSGFLTEEKTTENTKKEFTWIIDPLDGTTNFIHGIPLYCISVALMHKEEIILGIVYEINQEECFYTYRDAPSFLNNNLIQVSPQTDFQHALVVTGFPYHVEDIIDPYLNIFKSITLSTRGIRRLGSAATDLAYVACGRFDAFYEIRLNPWDVAAGALLVQNAGGKVIDFAGGSQWLYGKQIIAGAPAAVNKILEIIKPFQHYF